MQLLIINECASSPCRNDATCLDLLNAFECVCAAGFTGHNCSIGQWNYMDSRGFKSAYKYSRQNLDVTSAYT